MLPGVCLPSRGSSLLRLFSVSPDFHFRQECSYNYPTIVATIRKMPFCITNTFTSHTVISFFIIPSVTFLCNGIWRVCLTLDGHRDAARAASLLTQWRACSRGANLVSVIQPCKTGAQPAALFLTRLCVCCPMKQQTTAAGRVYGFRCAAGTAGAAGAVSGVNLCSTASF